MRARPWLPGDNHTTDTADGDPDIGDNSLLMVLLDVSGTHQTSIVHDEGCSKKNRYWYLDPIGMLTASASSALGLDNTGYLGSSYDSPVGYALIGSPFGLYGNGAGLAYGLSK